MQKKELFKNILHFSFGSIFSVLVGFIAVPVSTRLISPYQFGCASMFTLFISLAVFFVLFGFDQAFVRFFYEESESNRGKLLYMALSPSALLFLVLLLGVTLFYKSFFLFITGETKPAFSYVIIFAVGVICQVLQYYALLVVRMQKKGKVYSTLQICLQILNLVFLITYCKLVTPSFMAIIYAQIFSSFFVTCLGIFIERKYWKFWGIKNIETKNKLKDIFFIGSPLMINALFVWLFQGIDRLGLRHWSSLSEVGIYTASFKIVACITIFQTIFTTVWAPIAYEHYEKDRENKLFVKNIFELVFVFMSLVTVLLILFRSVVILLLGSKYAACVQIFPFLVFIPFMYTVSEVSGVGIGFSKKVWWNFFISMIALLINAIGIFILVPRFGGKGAAVSTGISYIFFFLIKTRIASRYYNLFISYLKTLIILLFIVLYAFYGIFYPSEKIIDVIIGVSILVMVILINARSINRFYFSALNVLKK